MIKENKKLLVITSIIILLPIAAGLLLWDRLPDVVATHWGFNGEADGWSSKAFAVFLPPVLMLATHWLCVFATASDPKNKKRNGKVQKLVLWTIPFVSLFSSAMLYGTALDAKLNITSITFAMVGIMFIIIGNYLPKTSQNFTIGIKVSWALADQDNWNATHRFGGRVYVIGGLALVLLAFLPTQLAIGWMVILLLVMGFVPILYSWLYYKKQQRSGIVHEIPPADAATRKINKAAWIIVAVILILVAILMFSGHIDCTFGDDSFTVEASYWNDLTVDYDQITALELRDGNVSGTRVWGFGSFRLLLGAFENEEFGNHTRYTYYAPDACVVVTCGEKILVLSGADADETKAIYKELTTRTEG